MEKELKLQYFERLITKNGSEKYFIEQFLEGSGHELEKKFWSDISSSRLCFDLYSWLCKEEDVKNFQFEKHLPGVLVGVNKDGKKREAPGTPNMDAFFEIGDDVIFIESKYTEKSKWEYKDDKYKDGFYLSEAYWGEKKEGYKSCRLTIGERFYGYNKIAELFCAFCKEIQAEITKRKGDELNKFSWFDPKQETCHLFGIIFYVIQNGIKNKNIFLCNNVYEIKDSDCFDISGSFVEVFKEKAELMLNEVFKVNNCKFTFEVNTIQDMLQNGFKGKDFANARLFATHDVSLVDYIEKNYKAIKR
jgi:hypothetical protein